MWCVRSRVCVVGVCTPCVCVCVRGACGGVCGVCEEGVCSVCVVCVCVGGVHAVCVGRGVHAVWCEWCVQAVCVWRGCARRVCVWREVVCVCVYVCVGIV